MIDILFCGNSGVFDGALTCILSILKRTQSKQPFTFHLFTMDLSDLDPKYTPIPREQVDFLNEVIQRYHPDSRAVLYDVTEYYQKYFAGCPNEGAYCSPYTLIRSTTKRKVLPQRYNDQKFLHPHTIVRHFSKRLFWMPYPHTDNIKQWHIEKVHTVFKYHQFDDILEEYLTLKENFNARI